MIYTAFNCGEPRTVILFAKFYRAAGTDTQPTCAQTTAAI